MGDSTFKTIPCETLDEGKKYDLCIFVDFTDRSDDVLVLNGDDQIFVGKLLKEGTSVSVVFDSEDEIEVKIVFIFILSKFIKFFHSNRLETKYLFINPFSFLDCNRQPAFRWKNFFPCQS